MFQRPHQPARSKILLLLVLGLLLSLACSAPFGLGVDRSQLPDNLGTDGGEIVIQATPTPTPTETPSPTPTPTFTPTETPLPTATSTRVVVATFTPSPSPTIATLGGGLGDNPTPTPTLAPGETPPPPADPGDPAVPAATPAPQVTTVIVYRSASEGNLLVNADFEEPWPNRNQVAPGWNTFNSDGAIVGWYYEGWHEMVYSGDQALMMAVISDEGQEDRFAGVYQTLNVVAGAEYELEVFGLIRSPEGSNRASGFGYIMQYGIDPTGTGDWTQVPEWVDLVLPEFPREDPNDQIDYVHGLYRTRLVPDSDTISLFFRGVKKWPDYREGNFVLDDLSFSGTGSARPISIQVTLPTPTPAPAVLTTTNTITTTQATTDTSSVAGGSDPTAEPATSSTEEPVLPVSGGTP